MAYNKVIFGDETLVDLTSDTVTEETLLAGSTAHNKAGEAIKGTCEYDSNTTDADATASEILKGKTAYVNKNKLEGTMTNNEGVTGTISERDGEYTIPQGFHDGSGKVSIDDTSKAACIASNIKEGITILGIEGTFSGSGGTSQAKTATPLKDKEVVVTPDEGVDFLSQVTVEAIPYTVTENSAGGNTITIAGV